MDATSAFFPLFYFLYEFSHADNRASHGAASNFLGVIAGNQHAKGIEKRPSKDSRTASALNAGTQFHWPRVFNHVPDGGSNRDLIALTVRLGRA